MVPELSFDTSDLDTPDRFEDPLGEGGGLINEVGDEVLTGLESLPQLVGLGRGSGQTGHPHDLGLQLLGLGAIRADLDQTLGNAQFVGQALDHMDLEHKITILVFFVFLNINLYYMHLLPVRWA